MTKETPLSRWYKGVLISSTLGTKAWRNGLRWQAHMEGHGFLYADTLKGIKALISEAIEN